MELARAVRNRTTGVLYVLDEPSIGLHPANIMGLNGVMHDLVRDGRFRHSGSIMIRRSWGKPTGSSKWDRRPEEKERNSHRRRNCGANEKNDVSVIGGYLAGKRIL